MNCSQTLALHLGLWVMRVGEQLNRSAMSLLSQVEATALNGIACERLALVVCFQLGDARIHRHLTIEVKRRHDGGHEVPPARRPLKRMVTRDGWRTHGFRVGCSFSFSLFSSALASPAFEVVLY